MPAAMRHESGNLFRIDVSGTLLHKELGEVQAIAARDIARLGSIKLLFVLEKFLGWERNADWGDLTFLRAHDQSIAKIAIVGDERWRDEGLAFAGAGLRVAAVRFYRPEQIGLARAWLAEGDRAPLPD
jgi:hypothetical protein